MTGQLDTWRNHAGECSKLPDDPFLIIVPPTLVEQVALECQRFLRAGSFDIIKITGSMDQHGEVWTEAEKRSEVPPSMRIYVATTTVSVEFMSYSKRVTMGTGGTIGVQPHTYTTWSGEANSAPNRGSTGGEDGFWTTIPRGCG